MSVSVGSRIANSLGFAGIAWDYASGKFKFGQLYRAEGKCRQGKHNLRVAWGCTVRVPHGFKSKAPTLIPVQAAGCKPNAKQSLGRIKAKANFEALKNFWLVRALLSYLDITVFETPNYLCTHPWLGSLLRLSLVFSDCWLQQTMPRTCPRRDIFWLPTGGKAGFFTSCDLGIVRWSGETIKWLSKNDFFE